MKAEKQFPKTLQECVRYFANDDNCMEFLKLMRWPDGIVKCPTCESKEVSYLSTRKVWKCKHAHEKQQFSIKVGTVMEDSAIPLDKWLCAFWLIANAKNGISSYELHRSIGVTQKTAWFMLHRVRLAMHDEKVEKFSGTVEADETFIGARARNMHAKKKAELRGRGSVGKTAVFGLLERHEGTGRPSRVRCKVIPRVRRVDLDPAVRTNVERGSEVMTDAFASYEKLTSEYEHKVIDHAEAYAHGRVHINGIENFWSLLKRGIRGTYVSVEPFHLFRYLDEQAFRFNERKDNDCGRFIKAVAGFIGKRLRYATLIAAEGGDGPYQATDAWQTA